MKALASILTIIAAVSTFMVAYFVTHVRGMVPGISTAVMLAPLWVQTLALDIACGALWWSITQSARKAAGHK